MANVFINGLALENFRAFGPKRQLMGPFSEINIFVGKNNAGKSTVLDFLTRHLNPEILTQQELWKRSFARLDQFESDEPKAIRFGFAVSNERLAGLLSENQQLLVLARRAVGQFVKEGLIWLYPDTSNRFLSFGQGEAAKHKSDLNDREWEHLWSMLTGKSGGGLLQHWIPEALGRLANLLAIELPEVKLIPAIRQIGPASEKRDELNGQGLIEKLAELQNPSHAQRKFASEKFRKINAFLAASTGFDDARIEIPHNKEEILIHLDGKVLPLSSVGFGIQEIIVLASWCTLIDKSLLCIEEPEIHLHPVLQRRFLGYLAENTSNQYFIATHSASMMDAAATTVFSVEMRSSGTEVCLAISPSERFEMCRQLGYRASDLMQADAVIWVEGPTDRLYLKHWLSHLAADLVEGVNFAIMFYGGRLLSHLTASDQEVGDFISLKRLNRNSAILIDSDKSSESDTLNDTKRRVRDSFIVEGGFVWITEGREIENYLPESEVILALAKMYPDAFSAIGGFGKFDHVLHFKMKNSEALYKGADKILVARSICGRSAMVEQLDLRKRLEELIEFIRAATVS